MNKRIFTWTKFIIANKYLYDVIFSNFSKVEYMRLSKYIKNLSNNWNVGTH